MVNHSEFNYSNDFNMQWLTRLFSNKFITGFNRLGNKCRHNVRKSIPNNRNVNLCVNDIVRDRYIVLSNQYGKYETRRYFSTSTSWRHSRDVIQKVESGNNNLEIETAGGDKELFPFVWLRDNCCCSHCFNSSTLSRLFLMKDLDLDIKPTNIKINENSTSLTIEWSDTHISEYPLDWLLKHSFKDDRIGQRLQQNKIDTKFWGANLQGKIPSSQYSEIMTNDGVLYDWLTHLGETGICLIEAAPQEEAVVEELCERVAHMRESNYGKMFTVKDKPNPNNLAFTSAQLGLHTDLPYYEYVPGIQLLHCITQTPMEGGVNEFSDGFTIAKVMADKYPDEFKILTNHLVDFVDIGEEKSSFHLCTRKPMISLDDDGSPRAIHFNNQVRDTYLNLSLDKVVPLYRAMKTYNDLLYSDDYHITHKLKQGEVVVFDNIRVLHGRTGYTSTTGLQRHLQGGYMEWSDVLSTWRVLKRKPQRE